MAGLRRRLLLAVLPAAASLAVIAAATWLLCPCSEGQPADPDGDAGPLPDSCTPLSRGTVRGVASALGFVLGLACYHVYDRFADGDDDDDEEAARAKKRRGTSPSLAAARTEARPPAGSSIGVGQSE